MGSILVQTRLPRGPLDAQPRPHVQCASSNCAPAQLPLWTHADQKGFGRLVARGLGLDRLDHPEAVLEQLGQLAVAAAVEHLAHQRAVAVQVLPGRIPPPVRPGAPCAPRRPIRCPTGWAPCRTAPGRRAGRPSTATNCCSTASSRKSPWMNCTPSTGSKSSRSRAMMRPCSSPLAAPPLPAILGAKRRRRYWLQAPGAQPRSMTSWPGLIRPRRLVDLLQLVGRARAVALLLRQLDVGVVDMVVEPGLVDFAALAVDLHGGPIIVGCLH